MLNDNGKNACLSGGLGNAVTHVSMHTAEPDSTGSNEVAGGSYARQAVTWTSASSGVRDNNADLTHPIPAGTTVTHYGLWSALSSGTYYGSIPRVGAGESISGFGTVDAAGVTGDLIQSAAHGLSNDQRVIVYNVFGESLPTGLTEGTIYWVVGVTTNTFQVSTTQGGSAVNITAQGELVFQRVVPETFSSAGNHVTQTGALDLSLAVI